MATKKNARDEQEKTRSILKPALLPISIGAVLPFIVASPVFADESASALEEVIVTVSRRTQNLQDFAGTAQAFSSDDLARSGVGTDFSNLQNVIPGLQISENEGFKEIYIRGIGTQSNGATDDSATAVHYNGVYLPRSRGIGPMIFDLERVEVNKGPQGTLRGRNATAGSVNFISTKPDFDAVGGYIKAGLGTFDAQEYQGALNVPVNETLAVRGAIYSRENDNTYDNDLKGQQLNGFTNNVDGTGAIDEQALRLSVLWEPIEAFSAQFVYDQADQNGNGLPGNYFGQAFSSGETIESLSDPYNQHFLTEGKTYNDIEGYNLVLTYDFGPVIVEYNGGYREHDSFNRNSRRPFQFGVANDAITGVNDVLTADFNNFGTNHILDKSEAVIHELRVFSPDDSRLRWTVGLFSLDEEQSETRFDTSDRSLTQSSLGGESASDSDIEAFSVFADATFDISDSLRVKAGIRRTKDDKSSTGFQAQYAFDFGPDIAADDVRFSTPGYMPTSPGDRVFKDPNDPNVSAADFFLAGVQRFGGNDTLDELVRANPNAVTLTTTDGLGLHTRKFDESYTDWRAGVEFDLNDSTMLYATVTTGSRSGGINPTITLQVVDAEASPGPDGNDVFINVRDDSNFNREQLTSWELGAKNEFEVAEMPIQFNANLFFYQYEDQVLQVAGVGSGGGFTPGTTNVDANLITRNVNIGESELLGLELDGALVLPYELELGWNFAYLDSEYKDAIIQDGRQAGNQNVDISGNQMQNVSKYNLVMHLGQEIGLDWGSVDWRVTASYRSKFYSTPYEGKGYDGQGNEIPLASLETCCFPDAVGNGTFFNDKVDGFTIWNLSAGVNFGNSEQYRIEGFVNNVTDEVYAQKQIINYFVNIAFLSAQRTAGVNFKMEF